MSSPITPSRGNAASWQERLQDHCRLAAYPPPVFNILSDRRGGRTAWSSTVTIRASNSDAPMPQIIQARYWYDGEHVNNAKEDAAEMALRTLTSNSPESPLSNRGGGPQGAGFPGLGDGGPGMSSWPHSPPSRR